MRHPSRYSPALLLFLALSLALLGYSTSLSALAVILTTLFLASLRPPPPLYQTALLALTILYNLSLLTLPLLSKPSLASLLAIIDTTYPPTPLRPRTTTCTPTAANILSTLDIYVLAHVLGHVVKAAILRDRLAVALSALIFEALEAVLAHLLPAFAHLAECAWDKLVLDLLLSDVAGMEAGLALSGTAPLSAAASATAAIVVAAVDGGHFCIGAALGLAILSPLLVGRMALLTALGAEAGRTLRRRQEGVVGTAQRALVATLAVEGVVCTALLKRGNS